MPTFKNNNISLTEKQRREILWFAGDHIDGEIELTGRQNAHQKALEAKGLVTIQRSEYGPRHVTMHLTEAGLEWLIADQEAAERIATYRTAQSKMNAFLRDVLHQFESLLKEDVALASLFTKQGFITARHLYTPGNEEYTKYQLEARVNIFTDRLEKMARQIQRELEDAKFQEQLDEKTQYLKEHRLYFWTDAAKLVHLTNQEFRAGFEKGIIKPVKVPWGYSSITYIQDGFFTADPLSDEQITTIKAATLLNRFDSAARLGIDVKQFDKLKKRVKLQHADTYPTDSGWPGYLYRQTDIDALKGYVE